MSFILDALQRAESLRGSQTNSLPPDSALADIAEPPTATRSIWWSAGLLAGLSVAALLVYYSLDPSGTTGSQTGLSPGNNTHEPSFSAITPDTPLAEVATPARRQVRALNREVSRDTVSKPVTPGNVSVSEEPLSATTTTPARVTPGTVTVSQEALSASNTPTRVLTNIVGENLPSYQEMILTRRIQLPEFHLDIHVYAPVPERRFVFVNNRKYREGAKLDEGGTVERITPMGAILNHRGHRFELVPD